MKRLLSIWLATSLLAVITPLAHAFCLAPKLRIDDEYFTSDLIFTGTIVGDKKVRVAPDGFYEGHIFSWHVDRALRGPVKSGDIVQTYSGDDSGRFPFEAEEGHQVGRRFLLFVVADPSQKGRFVVDNCGNSIELSKAAPRIAEIEQIPYPHRGLLYGVMFDGDEGAKIVATGTDGKRSSTVSGSGGRFAIHVPPGVYSVKATASGHVYADYELAYKRSEAVKVPDGGSAGVAFREKGR